MEAGTGGGAGSAPVSSDFRPFVIARLSLKCGVQLLKHVYLSFPRKKACSIFGHEGNNPTVLSVSRKPKNIKMRLKVNELLLRSLHRSSHTLFCLDGHTKNVTYVYICQLFDTPAPRPSHH